MPDETCMAFDSVAPFNPNTLHRFIVGADPAPRAMSLAEVKALGDPFASLLLARGIVPRSGEEVLAKIKAAVPANSPLKQHSSFILGEGSQLASTVESAAVDRTLRFVITVGTGPNGPDLMLSVPDPNQPNLIELMAWDRKVGGFNYYRSTGDGAMWMFAGNSRDALRDASHRSGAPVMKELKTPWINWHSPAANIPDTAFAANDPRRTHDWFKNKEPGGGLTFEFEAARPAMTRWAKARFAKLRKGGGTVARHRQDLCEVPREVRRSHGRRRWLHRQGRHALLLSGARTRIRRPSRLARGRRDGARQQETGRVPADGRSLEPDLLRPPARSSTSRTLDRQDREGQEHFFARAGERDPRGRQDRARRHT